MKTTIEVNRPYVHGSVQVSWIGEVFSRLHVCTDALAVNSVPVIIEGVLVRTGDVWRWDSFALQRATRGHANTHGCGYWKTSRRNGERAREVVLDVVSKWAGGRAREIQPPRLVPESRADGALLVELLGAC